MYSTSCLIAVKNPCGLKNPVIQNTLGRAVNIHAENCEFRSISSVNQNPRVDDSHDTYIYKHNDNDNTNTIIINKINNYD